MHWRKPSFLGYMRLNIAHNWIPFRVILHEKNMVFLSCDAGPPKSYSMSSGWENMKWLSWKRELGKMNFDDSSKELEILKKHCTMDEKRHTAIIS